MLATGKTQGAQAPTSAMTDGGIVHGVSRLLSALDDEVLVEVGLFGLIDNDGPPPGGPNWLTIGAPETLTAGPNCVALRSGGTDHFAAVRLESWDSAPPAEDGWDAAWTTQLPLSSGVVRLVALTAPTSGRTLCLTGEGNYGLTVYSRGRAAAAAPPPVTGPFIRSGVEQWLLRFWPVRPRLSVTG